MIHSDPAAVNTDIVVSDSGSEYIRSLAVIGYLKRVQVTVTITYKEYYSGAPPSGRAKRGREESARELRSCRSNAEADRNEAGEA